MLIIIIRYKFLKKDLKKHYEFYIYIYIMIFLVRIIQVLIYSNSKDYKLKF